jgi:hypothetical protein
MSYRPPNLRGARVFFAYIRAALVLAAPQIPATGAVALSL